MEEVSLPVRKWENKINSDNILSMEPAYGGFYFFVWFCYVLLTPTQTRVEISMRFNSSFSLRVSKQREGRKVSSRSRETSASHVFII